MDCQRAREGFVDALTGNLGEAERAELRMHVEQCAACRAERDAVTGIWSALETLDAPAPLPSLPERFERRLRRESGKPRRSGWVWVAAGALAATLVLGFGVGYGWRARGAGDGPATGEAAPPGYLMLLRAGASVPATEARAVYHEYAAWARALASQNRLVSAEELADGGTWLIAGADEPTAHPTPQAASQPIVGFFWIQAASVDSAVAQAKDSPHLRRGGTIEIRAIQRR
jgi:hypothetical protein